jgi:hypothetical protein
LVTAEHDLRDRRSLGPVQPAPRAGLGDHRRPAGCDADPDAGVGEPQDLELLVKGGG